MSEQLSAYIYILIMYLATFSYLKIAVDHKVFRHDFNIWFVTCLAILTLTFWSFDFRIFIGLSAIVIVFATRLAENKLAIFCLLLFLVPGFSLRISVLPVINFQRELSLIVLLPLFMAIKPNADVPRLGKLNADKLIVGHLILTSLLYLRGMNDAVDPTTFTEAIRVWLYTFCEGFLPYYVASRYIKDFEQLKTVLFSFITASMLVASVAFVEVTKSWLLYGSVDRFLNVEAWRLTSYIGRSGFIRATASLDHPLALSFVVLVAMGLFLAMCHFITNKKLGLAGFGLLAIGIFAPISRGAWLGAFVMLASYFMTGHKKGKNFTLFIAGTLLMIPLLYLTPGGSKVLNLLPFVGNVEKDNIDYRAKLIDQSILVIKKYPMFGTSSPKLEPELQVMKQGEGIIDLVNYYLELTLYYGLIGLILLMGGFITLMFSLLKRIKQIADKTSAEYFCGKSLLAIFVGMLFTISTMSSMLVVDIVLFLMAGITVSYLRVTDISRLNNQRTSEQTEEKMSYPMSRVVKV